MVELEDIRPSAQPRELIQTDQRSTSRRGNRLFDGVRVFEAGAGDHADDVGVGGEAAFASGSQGTGEGDGSGGFGENTFVAGEAALSFPDFGIGDDVAAAAGGSAFGDGPVAVVDRRDLQAADPRRAGHFASLSVSVSQRRGHRVVPLGLHDFDGGTLREPAPFDQLAKASRGGDGESASAGGAEEKVDRRRQLGV